MQRFDLATLAAPAMLEPPTAAEQAALVQWRRWCLAEQPFAAATLAEGPGIDAVRLATLLCLDLDGSWRLQACSGMAARLWLRGTTLLNDANWWRARQDSDPWDCGLLRDDEPGRAALAHFKPRRATLMVAQQMSPAGLARAVASLQERQALWSRPVRLLIVN